MLRERFSVRDTRIFSPLIESTLFRMPFLQNRSFRLEIQSALPPFRNNMRIKICDHVLYGFDNRPER